VGWSGKQGAPAHYFCVPGLGGEGDKRRINANRRESTKLVSLLAIALLRRLLLQIGVVMVVVVMMMGVYYHHLRLRRKRHREAGDENQSKQILFHTPDVDPQGGSLLSRFDLFAKARLYE
jgi:hypothetical protein